MDKLKIDLTNCFGIGRLNHEFDFTKSNAFLIYAPNGTMKTSFAHTFDLISKKNIDKICDRVYSSRSSEALVLVDGNEIDPEKILVVNAEDTSFDASNKISSFLASKELKNRYDEIYIDLNERKGEFIKKLKVISQSTDCESEFVNTFSEGINTSFFEMLVRQLEFLKENFEKVNFRYNDIFDKKGNVEKFLSKNKTTLNQYVTDYKNIISKSKFFNQTGENNFGTYQANEIINSTADNAFFKAGHKFVLEDGTEIDDYEKLRLVVQEEIQNILKDEKLQKAFDKLDKGIGANVELRAFKRIIEKDNLLLVRLEDYNKFKKEVWLNYLSEIKLEAEQLTFYYKEQKKELEGIIKEAKKEFDLWNKIIKTFNDRFYVPFKVILVNQEDIVLKQETANLEFEYSDGDEGPVRQNRDNLLSVLSKGEQRAYFILQFLFEIESRKQNPDKTILIFDDIADSFDYKNKFAIIEYIKDLYNLGTFRIIILTHNFDFYRTVSSRLYLPRGVIYMATKSSGKYIKLHNGQYLKDIFTYFIDRFSDPKVFISLITFVRNLIEYSESDTCHQYLTLTNCLHKKEISSELTAQNIFDIYKSRLIKLDGKTIPFGGKNLIQMIFDTADSISAETNIDEILLENKITLAIAIRLKAEEYLISKLIHFDLKKITSNQTQKLYQEYRNKFPLSDALIILDKVNLMTPENIHMNAFMFEPLIDMSVYHLIDLYKETCNMNKYILI